ncbi:glycosyl hydrolase family 18 protein [Chitinophaga sp. YR573]|uniref:glycosyl hydrolase family 18 protein n=1 Tax=Chitinophaga sp. YR573 TaxID=1881040 RepID=UPI0015A58C5E|nr:glycosyl hydrolase family 18 protein [Chitinophaga sp. YR573]
MLLLALCLGVAPAFSQLSRLHADGKKIVNASGQEVILKGVGLGGWLLQEGYMIKEGYSGYGTQWSIKQRLYNQGQTDAQVEAFYQSWRDNFITKADIDYIASLGFNCVRLPMHYDLFLTSAQRAVRNGVARNNANYESYVSSLTSWYNGNTLFTDPNLEGFRLADSVLRWASANNMYVILDLHAAPGGQGSDLNIADIFPGQEHGLWNRSIYRDITNRLWQKLSAHYTNNDAVAFYDLINEPNNVPANQTIHDLFERLINSIRALGDTHLLMVEGNAYGNNYNYMEPFTFTNRTNLVYNAHRYGNSTSTTATSGDINQISELGNIVNFRNTNNCPVWVGETGENNNSWLSANIAAMNSLGIGWCHWTYKRTTSGESPALLRINPPTLMDGAGNMAAVLNNIKFANNVKNTSTIAAVAPGTPPTNTTAPIGKTIWLRGFNNLYVSSEDGATTGMNCNRATVQGWEQFLVVDAGNGKIALSNNGKFVSSEDGQQAITCNRATVQGWEAFDWVPTTDGKVFLRGSNGLYVSSENGTQAMTCTRTTPSGWEAFAYGEVSAAARVAAAAAASSFKVVGYMPSWAGSVDAVQYSKLTHINYAFILPTSTGGLTAVEDATKLRNLITKAHANGVKVEISIGGWNNGNDGAFEAFAANSTYRTNFTNNVLNLINQYGLDGADIDWEYPDNGASANNYVALMTQLATALHAQGKLLTAAVVGTDGASILNAVFAQVDFLNLMAYDYNDFQHSTYAYGQQSLNYWVGRGLPKEKAILGVPFYARPSWDNYNVLLQKGASPYADVWNNNGYNGITTIKNKTNFAYDNGGGIMIWELSGDEGTGANSLVSAIHDAIIAKGGGTTPPPTTTAPVGQTIWLKGFNGQYVSSEDGDTAGMNCNRATVQGWEQFTVVDAGNGKVALSNQGLYVSSENGTKTITCNRATVQGWEAFDWITNADGTISLRGNNGLYVSSENGTKAMTCNRATAQGWENFNYGIVSAAAAKIAATKADISLETSTGVLVYPNPVTKGTTLTVNVQKYDGTAPVQVSMVDVNKRVVAYKKVNAPTVSVSTGNVSSGFYIMVITNGKNSYTKKVIIQ